jgi:hypothetical protein
LKAFIAFFFKQPKKKAKVKVAPGKRKRGQPAPPPEPEPELQEEEEDPVVAEVAVDEEGIMDEGKAAHDEATIRSVRGQAIAEGLRRGLRMTAQDEDAALTLFPKVLLLLCLRTILLIRFSGCGFGTPHSRFRHASRQIREVGQGQ